MIRHPYGAQSRPGQLDQRHQNQRAKTGMVNFGYGIPAAPHLWKMCKPLWILWLRALGAPHLHGTSMNVQPLHPMADIVIGQGGEVWRRKKQTDETNENLHAEQNSPPPKPVPRAPEAQRKRSSLRGEKQGVKTAMVITKEGTSALHHTLYNSKLDKSALDQLFEKIRTLGSGAFGEVIEARSRITPELSYAVKISKKALNTKTKYREAHALLLMKGHNNIIAMHNAWEDQEKVFIQTELCDGDLAAELLKRCFEEHEVWDLFTDMLLALDHLHKLKLLHNDIKPENIFLGQDHRYKLGDFGLMCKEEHSILEMEASGEGDSRYLPREVLRSKRTRASDVFSFGVTLFEVMSNVVIPKEGVVWAALRQELIPNELFSGFSVQLRRLVTSMMRFHAHKRPTCAELLDNKGYFKKVVQRKSDITAMNSPGKVPPNHVIFSGSPLPSVSSDTVTSSVSTPVKVKPLNFDSPTMQSPPSKRLTNCWRNGSNNDQGAVTPSAPRHNPASAATWPPKGNAFSTPRSLFTAPRPVTLPQIAEHQNPDCQPSTSGPSTSKPSSACSIQTPTKKGNRRPLRPRKIEDEVVVVQHPEEPAPALPPIHQLSFNQDIENMRFEPKG